jgi:hypothetical protein
MVGDGTISDRRDGGSLRDSEFQMPVPHGKELPPAWFQLNEPLSPGLVVFALQGPCSVEGLTGLEGADVSGPPDKECLRWAESGISFSHEVRRTGFVAGAVIVWVREMWSPSSSEEASASESGVERRTPGWLLSSRAVAVVLDTGKVLDCMMGFCLLDGAAITFLHMIRALAYVL